MQTTFCPYCLRAVQGDICPHCGRDVNDPGNPMQLPVGHTLQGNRPYVLGAAIGQGGFGITYIALDAYTNCRVAVKEYFPTHCAGRNSEMCVWPYSGQEEVFRKGREQFLLEAQTLQSLSDLNGIVNVLDYFEVNNTAYLAMEFLEGCSLKDHVQQHGKFPAHQFLRQFRPLMEDIEAMHRRGVIHRDIAPDNIMLLPDGRMKLIDFGAARSYLGDKSMTVVVKKGFAPVEQYMRKGSGTFTDVYALAATIYYCVTGQVPLDSVERQYGEETMQEPAAYGAELTDKQVEALSRALVIQPKARTQNVAQLMEGLYSKADEASLPPPSIEPVSDMISETAQTSLQPPSPPKPRKKWLISGVAAGLVLILGVAGLSLVRGRKPLETPSVQTEAALQTQPQLPQEPRSESSVNYLMMDEELSKLTTYDYKEVPGYEFLNTGHKRSQIGAVTFWDNMASVPDPHWDVSEFQTGSVLAWSEPMDAGLVHVHIAANGDINAKYGCENLFAGCENLTAITFNGALDTTEVTELDRMFFGCTSLSSVDLSDFDTSSAADLNCMFSYCKNLREIDVSHFDTSQVTNMNSMFSGCENLREIDIRNFDTSQVASMNSMFSYCDDLRTVNMTGLDIGNVTSMAYMFAYCTSLTEIRGIEDWNTASLKYVFDMFFSCTKLPDLTLYWDVSLLKNGEKGNYEFFMDVDKKINGRPWAEFFQ